MLAAQHPIQRPAAGDKFLARLRFQRLVDQRVNCGMTDAGKISGSVHIGGGGVEIGAQFFAGAPGHDQNVVDDVEVEVFEAFLVLRRIDDAHLRADAQKFQIFYVPLSTQVIDGTRVKIYAWYDNEFGYSKRMAELCHIVAAKYIAGVEPEYKYE